MRALRHPETPGRKYVTERAYDNPKFVEDMVRDIAGRLNQDGRVLAYVVESENFESIHNHSAYALIERDKQVEHERRDNSDMKQRVTRLLADFERSAVKA